MVTHPLQAFRTKAGLSLQQMADLLSVSAATVSRIENGKQAVTADMAVKIEQATKEEVPRWRALNWPDPAPSEPEAASAS